METIERADQLAVGDELQLDDGSDAKVRGLRLGQYRVELPHNHAPKLGGLRAGIVASIKAGHRNSRLVVLAPEMGCAGRGNA